MQLTPQQQSILSAQGDIKINAVAGSGKTTTVIQFAKSRPSNAKILYIAFNKSVRIEAEQKFAEHLISNVQIETAHSLAYKHVVIRSVYKIKAGDYKSYEVARILSFAPNIESYILANHVIKMCAFFCNSNADKVQSIDYVATIHDPKAKIFVKNFYAQIEMQTRLFLAKMNTGEIEITHDFYLKKFQLAQPKLNFDYILFDEGQDASPAMLDVFVKQSAIKIIVGDTHQQIYSWRYAINSLQQVHAPTFELSTSFRFQQDIADLAMQVLDWKTKISDYKPMQIIGAGNAQKIKTKAIIGRTNLGLLLKAITYITDNRKVKHIYFEGNFNSYTYASDGASLYDVLNLYNGKKSLVRDELIKGMRSISELENYIEQTEDAQLGMMLEVVKEYENEIPSLIKKLKEMQVADGNKDKAEIIFSTVHRCKGMEYDEVELVADFLSEEKLDRMLNQKDDKGRVIKLSDKQKEKIGEEINLLYVAVTRTKKTLKIPESIIPKDTINSASIQILQTLVDDKADAKKIAPSALILPDYKARRGTNAKPNRFEPSHAEPKREAYKPWTVDEENKLLQLFESNASYDELAKKFGRTKGAIMARLRKLGVIA
jgi:F-box protein, helicase, 18